jgi:hypothetical protein
LAENHAVPFLIKLPHQEHGEVVLDPVDTVDLLPTIADVVGADIPWPVDGRSVFGREVGPRDHFVTLEKGNRRIERDIAALEIQMQRDLKRKSKLFGRAPGNAGLFRIGRSRSLLGREVRAIPHAEAPGKFHLRIRELELLRDVDLASQQIPAAISGDLSGTDLVGRSIELAVAINGRIEAVTMTHRNERGESRFMAMIPWTSLKQGPNQIRVYRILGRGRSLRLQAPLEDPKLLE